VNCARWDLCGGYQVTGIPTAILDPRAVTRSELQSGPTFVETPMMARPDFAQWVRERIPAGRVGQPEDVAAAAVFAASPAASLVTGTSLVVDGGWTAQ